MQNTKASSQEYADVWLCMTCAQTHFDERDALMQVYLNVFELLSSERLFLVVDYQSTQCSQDPNERNLVSQFISCMRFIKLDFEAITSLHCDFIICYMCVYICTYSSDMTLSVHESPCKDSP